MIKFIKADAVKLNASESDSVLIHVCNDCGVMGSGIALQIKNEHPSAFDIYYQHYRHFSKQQYEFGGNGFMCKDSRIFNMVAQSGFRGSNATNGRFLDYGWLANCIVQLTDELREMPQIRKIIIPVKMGAFRAGGDWEIVQEIVVGLLRDEEYDLVFCKFDRG
ncbi:macro domain protein [Alishewanella phage vB_AspM_Slickus01]|nr:macro domain protein [Alishewanella phage vB_AspM_Slicko01]WGH49767.1 macro domain protein [Alishewanella phage vB_AspM_Slickus01]